MPTFSLRNSTIKIKDGTSPTPNEISVKIGDGNITFSEKKARVYLMDRDKIDTVEDGPDEPLDVSIDARWELLKSVSGEDITIEDALKNRGEASDWVSSDANECAPYAVDIVIEFDVESICADTENERITLPDFRYESLDHDAKGRSLAIKGKCNSTEAIVVRYTTTTTA